MTEADVKEAYLSFRLFFFADRYVVTDGFTRNGCAHIYCEGTAEECLFWLSTTATQYLEKPHSIRMEFPTPKTFTALDLDLDL